jgi:Mrp family chromosome partitioning ATPase
MSPGIAKDHLLSFCVPSDRNAHRQVTIPRHSVDPALLLAPNPSSALASHYRDAASTLLDNSDRFTSPLFITSPRRGDGKTATAFNLAYSLQDAKRSILLVELNFLEPRFRSALGNLKLHYGIDCALRGAALPAHSVSSLEGTSLHIAAVRSAVPIMRLPQIFTHLDAYLAWATENFDLVLLDCPSVLSQEWNLWFRDHAGTSLLVVREGRTPFVEIQQASRLLGQRLQGVLLNAARHAPARLTAPSPQKRLSLSEEMRAASANRNI